jgi:hypothetical protein
LSIFARKIYITFKFGVAGSRYEKLDEKGGSWELGAGGIKCTNRKPYLNSATPKFKLTVKG